MFLVILFVGLAVGVCVLNSFFRVEVVLVRVGLIVFSSFIFIFNFFLIVVVLLGMGMVNFIVGVIVVVVLGVVLVVFGKVGGKVVVFSLKFLFCVDVVLVFNVKFVKEIEEIIV